MLHESKHSFHIHLEIVFKWSCVRVCHKGALSFIRYILDQLAQKCRYHCELYTTEFEMDLNYQQLRLRSFH